MFVIKVVDGVRETRTAHANENVARFNFRRLFEDYNSKSINYELDNDVYIYLIEEKKSEDLTIEHEAWKIIAHKMDRNTHSYLELNYLELVELRNTLILFKNSRLMFNRELIEKVDKLLNRYERKQQNEK